MFEVYKSLQHLDTKDSYEVRKEVQRKIYLQNKMREAERDFENLYPKYEPNLQNLSITQR